MSSEEKKSEISFFNANFTSIISVALVLVLFGMVAFFVIVGNNLSNQVRESIGFTVIVKEDASEAQINQLKQMWNRAEYVSSVKYMSREDALGDWERETGENLIELLGVNPLNAEFDIKVKSDYASTVSLTKIANEVKTNPAVESVEIEREIIDAVNHNINNISIVLTLVAAVLMVISFALINNTIHLSVYSKRFLIHTMKLVGAKWSFIRRPFVVSNMLNGLISGILAVLLLGVAVYYTSTVVELTEELLPTAQMMLVFAGIIAAGVLMCGLAALISTNKYLRLDYDALFKR